MWDNCMTLEYVNYIPWTPRTNWEFAYNSYIQTKLGNLGGVMLLTLCAGIAVHPMRICKKHYLP